MNLTNSKLRQYLSHNSAFIAACVLILALLVLLGGLILFIEIYYTYNPLQPVQARPGQTIYFSTTSGKTRITTPMHLYANGEFTFDITFGRDITGRCGPQWETVPVNRVSVQCRFSDGIFSVIPPKLYSTNVQ